ncbi:MAG: hypothetical protein KME07_12575 [Pegethrix bostrychoides GSE-TBD4-15B]|jgi:hypothetical protein|uniref:Uncharacterized protein n=1 Tax=Pegethrix bostrychoides GSE-TBD4-15B TaxID=2839662 RepID=A0A951PBQ6_9CYAN|nr:hypothetical protein [Pegethrix bostrychoides GSE-TBD4-15B]
MAEIQGLNLAKISLPIKLEASTEYRNIQPPMLTLSRKAGRLSKNSPTLHINAVKYYLLHQKYIA